MADTKVSRKGTVTESSTGVDMKTAVQAAMVFVTDLIPSAKDIRLEEVEPGGPGWLVVVSYTVSQSPTFAVLRGEEGPRVFKKIPIDSESGTAQSLKAWK
jgi:hypothetical protein